ncbi:peptidoglycan-binding protein [Marivita sp. S6314]|uniref:peptidoglycan-binding domain-containing protein n=1 Tax=Marivita sp. S6314 TaxID=2926406 RepID=UPI001FF679DB|nr:peptidoglycan-binding domain-containing protein [Marivita sp. S6314]MCK0149951.1 peptidoglycan-binding protein [Marivita sp. S6314]
MTRLLFTIPLMLGMSVPAWADGSSVLVIGNGDARVLQRETGSRDLGELRQSFSEIATRVNTVAGANQRGMRTAFLAFARNLDARTEDVTLVLTGRFVSTVAGTYLMPADADGDVGLVRVLNEGFPLDSVYAVAAQFPGRALIVLGQTDGRGDLASGLSSDIPHQDIPQGVTVATGNLRNAMRVAHRLSEGDTDNVLSVIRSEDMALHGFVPDRLALLQGGSGDLPVVVDPPRQDQIAEDRAAWQDAVRADSEAGYQAYIRAFPRGEKTAEARQRLTAIQSEPFHREKRAEESLELSRDARRDIQRDLSLLGHNTRGIDGIFGRGTRGAISTWQEANGHTASGYLTATQIVMLDRQADKRAAELEEEARERQAALEREDRAYWAETGSRGSEGGYRAYLERFPDGFFAEVAQERLEEIEAERNALAEDRDKARWQVARREDTAQSYRAYLSERPNGAFAGEARARINWLQRNSGAREIERAAKAAEDALRLNAAGRRLAEGRLEAIGLKPGAVDGVFDKATRRAIRRYQNARKLRVTGYLDQATMVRLMADSILR